MRRSPIQPAISRLISTGPSPWGHMTAPTSSSRSAFRTEGNVRSCLGLRMPAQREGLGWLGVAARGSCFSSRSALSRLMMGSEEGWNYLSGALAVG